MSQKIWLTASRLELLKVLRPDVIVKLKDVESWIVPERRRWAEWQPYNDADEKRIRQELLYLAGNELTQVLARRKWSLSTEPDTPVSMERLKDLELWPQYIGLRITEQGTALLATSPQADMLSQPEAAKKAILKLLYDDLDQPKTPLRLSEELEQILGIDQELAERALNYLKECELVTYKYSHYTISRQGAQYVESNVSDSSFAEGPAT